MQRLNHSLCLRGASCFSGAKVLLKLAVTFFFHQKYLWHHLICKQQSYLGNMPTSSQRGEEKKRKNWK